MISGINYQSRGKGYQPKLKAKADNPYRDLDFSGYHVNRNTGADFESSLYAFANQKRDGEFNVS